MADAFVGGACLSATLQVLFDRLASREVVNFFSRRKHDDRLLRKLKLALKTVNVVLNDAEDKEITNSPVKDWLDEVKDAVYHADDLLDAIATEAVRCNYEAESQRGRNQVWHSASTSVSLFDEEVEFKIEQIIERLEYFAKEKDVLGLKDVGMKPSKRLPTTCLVDESAVYGRDDDKDKIIKLLLCDDVASNEIGVIPIVGMGGIGKTTLAQYAYNDPRVDEHFNTKAWVCVSEQFDVFRVTKTILVAVALSASDVNDLDDLNLLQLKLRGELSGKKFLIVLDDIWNEIYDDWDKLRIPFRDGVQGSKIIVTTRNESVASIMQTVPTHHLELLSDENCWSLFARHAFENGDPTAHPNLESIGKEIVKKCEGLPLAVKTLGGLLRFKWDIEEWENILKSNIWDLPNNKNNVLPLLRLSYHYLSSYLKRCFAYCSIFPKDYEFEKEKLVLLWIAEDLVKKPKGNKIIEEEGDNYFCELLSRSFFQRSGGNKSCFVMHNLVHDLAQLISGEFCFRLEDNKQHDISEKVRHFSYFRSRYDTCDKLKVINEVKCLRTFLQFKFPNIIGGYYLSNKVLHDMLPSLRCLRVLFLSHYEIFELPHSIGKLIHLRYLNLSHTRIQQLPDSITTLWNLQTLDLSGCLSLTELPIDMGKLINLRHLDIRETKLRKMPIQMSRIRGLQHLAIFVVGKDSGTRINELRELCHLRGTLSIQELQNVTNGAEALEANLKDKKHLENLELRWSGKTDDTQNERDVLDKLQPHVSVKNLTIENYGGTRFPDWLGQHLFSNIVSLCLSNCEYCHSLPPCGQLPSLKDLAIEGMNGITRVDVEFYGNACFIKPFRSLETLRFQDMPEWEEWCLLSVGEFSSLLELRIIQCPKLAGDLPNDISSLKKLEISGCQQLVRSLPNGQMTMLSDQVGILPQHLSSLRVLKISDILKLQELPSELSRLNNLEKLKIEECPSLLSLLKINTCLKRLHIDDCSSLVSFPVVGLPAFLKELEIGDCRKLEFRLSEEMEQCYTSLERLEIRCSCDSLKFLPLGLFPKLHSLAIVECTNFETLVIPNEIQNVVSLHSLSIISCTNMVSFPRGGLPASNLTFIWVNNCKNLKSLPEGMHLQLPSLQQLWIEECPELESFPEGGLPSNLHNLCIFNCKKLTNCRMEWGLQRLPYLKYFSIDAGIVEESFPEEFLLPSSLTDLRIFSFTNLKLLNHNGLKHLTSLQTLKICNCPNLHSLPEEGLPTSLSRLIIRKCPLLKSRCRMDKGEDWSKIARIPFIDIF